jgi:hypothetical protein
VVNFEIRSTDFKVACQKISFLRNPSPHCAAIRREVGKDERTTIIDTGYRNLISSKRSKKKETRNMISLFLSPFPTRYFSFPPLHLLFPSFNVLLLASFPTHRYVYQKTIKYQFKTSSNEDVVPWIIRK